MQESNPDINLSTRLERGSPENWFSEKNFIDHLCFKMGFDLNTNEVATFWKFRYFSKRISVKLKKNFKC